METKKISELTEVTSPTSTDVFPIVNDGETKKVQLTNIKNTLGINEIDTRLTTATKYITATAGSNGDFYINIPNALETGMILNITFPAATVSTANARLSIDNGVIYKNTDTIASEIQNRNMSFLYNGTSFQFIGVVSGSNANGSYIKFPDGTMICYISKEITGVDINNNYAGSGMYYSSLATIDLPETFISTPSIQISILSALQLVMASISTVTTTYFKYYSLCSISLTSQTVTICATAMGRWK